MIIQKANKDGSIEIIELTPEQEAILFPATPLSVLKDEKKKQINKERDIAAYTNVVTHGRPWQADAESQRLLANEILTTQAGAPMTPVWRDANNNNMTITDISELIAIASDIKYQVAQAYQTSWTRKAAVDAAASEVEVEVA